MNNNFITYKSRLKYALLACTFLCGNNVYCAEHANTAPAASLGAAFNGVGIPIDVILVSRDASTQARTFYMQLDDIALIFACLAVNLGGDRKAIRETLETIVTPFVYEKNYPNITYEFSQYGSNEQPKKLRRTDILNQFDKYCSLLPVSARRDSWKIVAFNETFFSKSTLTKNEVDKIRELFFKFVEDEKLIVYLNFLYQDNIKISKEEMDRICEAINDDTQFDYKTLNIIKWPKTNFCRFGSKPPLEDAFENRRLTDEYRQLLIRYNPGPQGKYPSIFNRTIAWYQNCQLCHYDKSSYFLECPDNSISSIGTFKVYYMGAGQDKIDCDGRVAKLADVVVNNISSEICFDIALGIRKSNKWTNKQQPSRLHIFVSNTSAANNSDNFPQDIVTACVDPLGIPARKTGENKAITGVFKGNQIFPYTAYSFTHKSCNYGIMVVKNIFKVH